MYAYYLSQGRLFDFTQDDITKYGRNFVGTSVMHRRLLDSLDRQPLNSVMDTPEEEERKEAAQKKEAVAIAAATALHSGTKDDAIVLDE